AGGHTNVQQQRVPLVRLDAVFATFGVDLDLVDREHHRRIATFMDETRFFFQLLRNIPSLICFRLALLSCVVVSALDSSAAQGGYRAGLILGARRGGKERAEQGSEGEASHRVFRSYCIAAWRVHDFRVPVLRRSSG